MFKYKIEILPLKTVGTTHLDAGKKQFLAALLNMLTMALKAMPEVIETTLDENQCLIVSAKEDIASRLKLFGTNVIVNLI